MATSVPPGDDWTTDPYGAEERHGAILWPRRRRLQGRFRRPMPAALLALERSDRPLDGGVELHLTYDEETGGFVGPKWLLGQGLSRAELRHHPSGLFLRDRDGAQQRHAASRGRRARPAGAAAVAAVGPDALEAATPVLAAIVGRERRRRGRRSAPTRARHRRPADHRRPDLGRHQHQCRAGPHRAAHRSPRSLPRRMARRSRRS